MFAKSPSLAGLGLIRRYSIKCDTRILSSNDKFHQAVFEGSSKNNMIIFTTPDYANDLIKICNDNKEKKINGFVIDVIGNYYSRGISRIFTTKSKEEDEEKIKLSILKKENNYEQQQQQDNNNNNNKWEIDEKLIYFNFTPKDKIAIPLSNTLFQSNYNVTAIINGELMMTNFKSIHIDMTRLNGVVSKFNHHLVKLQSPLPPLKITSSKGNLIKSINNKPASSFLLNSNQLMTSQHSIYAYIHHNNNHKRRFKIIAGGGQFGHRSALLAIDPDSLHYDEDLTHSCIEFYYNNQHQNTTPPPPPGDHPTIQFSTVAQSISSPPQPQQTKYIPNLACLSTESINGIRFNSYKLDDIGDVVNVEF